MSIHSLARNWWLLVLRGLAAILGGLALFSWPMITLTTLMFMVAAYLITDGSLAMAAGLGRYHKSQRWWLILIEGFVGILAGALLILLSGLSTSISFYLIAAWAVIAGMVKMVTAIRLRLNIHNELFLAANGILSAMLGLLLVIWHDPGGAGLLWILGAYALISGGLLSGLGFRLWNWQSLERMMLRPVWVGPRQHSRRSLEK